eukprot:1649175-Pyramimonas_sp.AAC.1
MTTATTTTASSSLSSRSLEGVGRCRDQAGWRYKTNGKPLPEFQKVKTVDGKLVATWPADGHAFTIPNIEVPVSRGKATAGDGVVGKWPHEGEDGGDVKVSIVKHRVKGEWLTITLKNKQIIELENYKP